MSIDRVVSPRTPRALLLAGVTAMALCNPAFAQPAPGQAGAPTPAKPVHTGPRANSIGDVYGTQNIDGLPGAADRLKGQFSARLARQHDLHQLFADIRTAQEGRIQPPSNLTGYIDYVRRDALLEELRKLAVKVPGATPDLLVLLGWNHVALDMTSIDHTTVGSQTEPTFGEQWGPARSSRAMAMVHLAMFEAANAIDQQFHSYKAPGAASDLRTTILAAYGATPTPADTSISAAIAEAGYRTLVGLYPRKSGLLLAANVQITALTKLLEAARGGDAASRITFGQQLGDIVAAQVLAMRAADHSSDPDPTDSCAVPGRQMNACLEPNFPNPLPPPPTSADAFTWSYDPISLLSIKLGGNWSHVSTFLGADTGLVTPSGLALPGGINLPKPQDTDASFLASLNDGAYGPQIPDPHGGKVPQAEDTAHQAALNKYLFGKPTAPTLPAKIASQYGVRQYGGAGTSLPLLPPPNQGPRTATPTSRSSFETAMAEFWGYDGVALLCAPPRLYNMIATSFFLDHAAKTGTAGSVVAAARYLAVVNLALADAGIEAWTGKFGFLVARPITYIRTHAGAGGAATDAQWTPLGQTGSNGLPYNTTPPFPAYPSGHAVFGGAAFTAIAQALGVNKTTSDSAFDFVSDEFNGHTIDGSGNVRPFMRVHFASLKSAEWENAESRIWLGIHWQRDADDGSALGEAIGTNVATTTLTKCNGSGCD